MNRIGIVIRELESLKSIKSIKDLKMFFKVNISKIFFVGGIFYGGLKAPPIIQIEPVNYCNLNCICCSVPRNSREKGCMNLNLFQKIIDEASDLGTNKVYLYLHGEPFLHPQIVEMIRYIKSKHLEFDIATNGMLLSKDKMEAILNSGVNCNDLIRFSILGYSKEVHEKIMKGVNHDKVLENIFYFLKLRKNYRANGPKIETFFYTISENEHEKKQFVKYWNGIVDRVGISHLSKSFWEYKRREKTIPPREKTCKILGSRLTIFWNGDVTICCSDVDGDYILGNLNEQSIRKIWKSKQLLSIKKLHKKKQFQKIPLCYRCDW